MLSSVGCAGFGCLPCPSIPHEITPREVFSFVFQHGFHAFLKESSEASRPKELNFGLFAQFIPLLNQLRRLPIEQLKGASPGFIRHLIIK